MVRYLFRHFDFPPGVGRSVDPETVIVEAEDFWGAYIQVATPDRPWIPRDMFTPGTFFTDSRPYPFEAWRESEVGWMPAIIPHRVPDDLGERLNGS